MRHTPPSRWSTTVEIEQAVSELCRVVKPGGRIGHHRQERGAMGKVGDAGRGERWFTRKGLERLLRRELPGGIERTFRMGRRGTGRTSSWRGWR